MPPLSSILAAAMLGSLVLYALLGGADFGGGVWYLLARGERADAQQRLITHAIGPVWETNHIWLIVAVVVLFTAFPPAYAAMSTALFVPLTLLLAGIVLRGAAFAFHSHHLEEAAGGSRWGILFAGASLVTPILLGVTIGAISSGRISRDPLLFTGDTGSWFTTFPVSVGALTLSAFAYLASVYLLQETEDPGLQDDFRRRALGAAVAVALFSVLVLATAAAGAPAFYRALTRSAWSFGMLMLGATAALGALASLWLRAFPLARVCAAAQVTLLLVGWGLAQFPYLVRPSITVAGAAAAPATLRPLAIALAVGAVLLFPSVFGLFRVFKRETLRRRRRPAR